MTGSGATLEEIQAASYEHAGTGIRVSWPLDTAMSAQQLAAFVGETTFGVLATRPDGRPQAAPVAFEMRDGAFWIATVAGARLRNLRRMPYASLVVSEGGRGDHRAVMTEGAVVLHESVPGQPEWAVTTIDLRPERLFSYDGTGRAAG